MTEPGKAAGQRDGSGRLKGLKDLGVTRLDYRRSRTAALVLAAGATIALSTWIFNVRGTGVPTVPKEEDRDKIHHPEGPVIVNAPKQQVQPGQAQGHSDALRPRMPSGNISVSRDNA